MDAMTTRWIVLALASLCLWPAALSAQGEKPDDKKGDKTTEKKKEDDPIHEELRAFKKSLIEAVKKGDIDAQLEHVTPDAVVTWQNGEVVTGRDNLRKFYEEHVKKSEIFKGYVKEPEPTALTVLYGSDTGISYGTSVGKYKIMGMTFELTNHWTATLVKHDGKWRIASYHVSNNVLANPLLTALYWAAGIGAVVVLLLGFIVGRISKRGS
jgi:ketosteroid isomerase-like protein